MARSRCGDEEFAAAWRECGGRMSDLRDRFGYSSDSSVCNKRSRVEKRLGITLSSASDNSIRNATTKRKNSRRLELTIKDGTILVGSDAHIWGKEWTTAQRAFIEFARRLKPSAIVLNGDVFDGARVSRHNPGTWGEMSETPDVKAELEGCQAFATSLKEAAPQARRVWTWGNHDMRFEHRLTAMLPQYIGVPGFALRDHFPEWDFCMALFVNQNLVIKHRFKSGIHAPHNNTLWAGRSIFTGHLHSQKVQPITDYTATRYGVDGGTMADPTSAQFSYAEENPTGWRAGFVVATFRGGQLLMPELVKVCDWEPDSVEFRGELIGV